MQRPRRLLQFVLILAVSCGAMLAGGQLAARVAGNTSDFYAPLETFSQVLFRVQHNYVEERPAEDLIEGAIEGSGCSCGMAAAPDAWIGLVLMGVVACRRFWRPFWC